MKNLNHSITLICIILKYLLLITVAVKLAQFCWWLAKPLGYTTASDETKTAVNAQQKPELIAQGITNRAPFGIIIDEKPPQPTIIDQIKLVGVYAAGKKNSIAFIQINGKNTIAQIGEHILDGTLVEVNSRGIVINSMQQNVTIPLNPSDASSASTNFTTPSNNNNNSYANQYHNSDANNVSSSTSDTVNGSAAAANSNQSGAQDYENARRKLIEQFQQQQQQPSSPTPAPH